MGIGIPVAAASPATVPAASSPSQAGSRVMVDPGPKDSSTGQTLMPPRRCPLPANKRLWRQRQREAGRKPKFYLAGAAYPAWTNPDGSWEGPYALSSQEEFSDEMPEDWVDKGPGHPSKLFCDPINMYDTTDRERAWRRRQKVLGRTPIKHNPYTVWSASKRRDGTWEGPYYTSSCDEYSDNMPADWTEDGGELAQGMALDTTLATPLTQLDPRDSQPRTVGKRSCPSHQAAPVERLKVGDITFSGSHTPSRPGGKTRLVSSSPASAMAIGGGPTSEERALRHLRLLTVAEDHVVPITSGLGDDTLSAPDIPVEHRDSAQGPPIPPPI